MEPAFSNMKKTAVLICSLILSLQVFASPAHSEDYLVVDGQGHFVRADPLFRYLSKYCNKDRLQDYVDNFCVPNGPNYTRHWEVKGHWFCLVKIENDKGEEYPLDLLFPDYDGSPVKARWYSGILSYQLGDSPVIQLNREYYEEESVIRIYQGEVTERFVTNHKERWISYSKRLLNKYRPLASGELELPTASSGSHEQMAEFLVDVFSPTTSPEDEPSEYYPTVEIKFKADLTGLQLTEAHRELTGQKLLETIAEETHADLEVAVSNRTVIYVIKEIEAPSP